MKQKKTEKNKEILIANIRYYQKEANAYAKAGTYAKHGSVFEESNRVRIQRIIEKLTLDNGLRQKGSILDLGCGTGNILKIAEPYFENLYGIDVSTHMLSEAKGYCPTANLIKASADMLPFKSNMFDCVSLYSVLHHIYDADPVLEEIYRVLKNGGVLYTDNDPNSYFVLRKFKWIKELLKPVDVKEKLAEYHKFGGGLNPLLIKEKLKYVGFSNIQVNFRSLTQSSKMSMFNTIYRFILKSLITIFHSIIFFHYFWISAQKVKSKQAGKNKIKTREKK